MIQFQKGYTTPEQSKKLLTLGVPIDSADMYYKHIMLTPYILSDGVLFSVYSKVEDVIPCWSNSRLMEIITLCHLSGDSRFCFREDMCESLVETIFKFVKCSEMDFSKLED